MTQILEVSPGQFGSLGMGIVMGMGIPFVAVLQPCSGIGTCVDARADLMSAHAFLAIPDWGAGCINPIGFRLCV
jgi:hypothetical protein